MAGFTIKVAVEDAAVKERMLSIRSKVGNATPAMELVGEIVTASVVKNFEVEGRPAWKKSRRAQKDGGQTLSKSGRLKKSITYKAGVMEVEIGTNLIYARIHQLGGEIKYAARERVLHFNQVNRGAITFGRPGNDENGKARTDRFAKAGKARYAMKVAGKAYTVVMPRRQFLMVQPEDWEEIRAALEEYLLTS